MTIEQAMELAGKHHEAGRLAESEAIYRRVLDGVPDHPGALHLLGVVAAQTGHLDAALDLIGRAIALNPAVADYHNSLGATYRQSGDWERAMACLSHAIELMPDYADAHNNLGNTLTDLGRLDAAIAAYRRAIALKPEFAEAESNLGALLFQTGQPEEAIAAYHRAIERKPDHCNAHINLAIALHATGLLDEAIAACRRVLELRPGLAEAHISLGNALKDIGRSEEAIAAYARAIAIKPDSPEGHNNLGVVLFETGNLTEAMAAYDRAVELKPDYAEVHNNRGNALKDQGRVDEALACFRRAVELKPGFCEAASNLLLTLQCHPDFDGQAILAEHRGWARRYAEPLAGSIRPHPNDRTPDRRLRIGFVSPDYRDHPVGRVLLPLFAHRDHRQAEFFCYSDVRAADAVTRRFQALGDQWRDTAGLDDAVLADRIRGDAIDILVDLALHTARNRMGLFSRKPAPVQVSMLGMPSTTGLATIDYRLTDAYFDPPGQSDRDYTERSIRLPHCIWCYEPFPESPPVGALPLERNGFVTLGNLNQFAKTSRPALIVWRSILRALPNARLVLKSPIGTHRAGVQRFFQEEGVAGDRVEFVSWIPRDGYLERFGGLDVWLDPFPYNGHTTTLDALWMGVPVVTLAGRTGVGRAGVSVLSNVGLPELIADTPRQYVTIALELAGDRARLSQLRAGLRRRMQSSPLLDGPRYAADVEAAFRRIWTTWCEQ